LHKKAEITERRIVLPLRELNEMMKEEK